MALPDGLASLAADLERAAAECRREIARHEHAIGRLQKVDLELTASANAIRAMQADGSQPGRSASVVVAAVRKIVERQVRERVGKQRAARAAASGGISRLKLQVRKDGSMIATIDKERLELPPRLAVVMRELVDAALAGPPGFVAHTTLTARIAARVGRPVTERSRVQLVHRLVKTFERRKLDHFIESDPRRGVRLLLRRARSATPAAQEDSGASSQRTRPASLASVPRRA